MIRTALAITYALTLALGLGGASAWLVTDRFAGFSPLTIGQWTGYPKAGAGTADPYARARAARTGQVPLGAAEGLVLTATHDADGAPLIGTCAYVIEGRDPPSRLWTLTMAGINGEALSSPPGVPTMAHSRSVLREADGRLRLALSDRARPGNWLYLRHDGPIRLVLTLYDTTVTASVALAEVTLPRIGKTGCRT